MSMMPVSHRHAAVHHGDGLLQHVIALRIGEEGHLARRAQEEQAIDAGLDHAVDGAFERLESSWRFSVSGMTTGGMTPRNGESVIGDNPLFQVSLQTVKG